jgi:Concanavalin A-like lectin/glucanases superfamily
MKIMLGNPILRQALVACAAGLATQAVRADYPSSVLADAPKAYYRFNDDTNRSLINVNSGSLGAAGNASHDLSQVFGGSVHSFPGAIVGDADRSAFFDFTTRTEIPFNAAVNPPATQPFTIEAWLYPSSDQVGTGMGALCNRWTQSGQRQGWVLYQRAPDTNHCVTCGPGVGWEFRMYNGVDSSGHIDVTSGVPFTLGEWQHVAITYIPVNGDPTNSMAVIYINGVAAATNINTASVPGYAACTGDHDPSVAVNGQPALSLGGYNNANGGTAGFGNPWFGAVDEFALYATNLTADQILAHYQNGTNANRATPYPTLIQSANPTVYLRLNDRAPEPDIANNLGDLRGLGIATNSAGVKHPATSAVAGDTADGASSYHQRNGYATGDIPYADNLNPNAGTPFSFELWLRPTSDRVNPGAAPINNRYVKSGNRTGWVIFQRAPDASYSNESGYSGVGWNFRMYSGSGSGGQDVTTGVDWVPGQWQHLVVTWEPQTDNGDVGSNGNDQWQGVLTTYVNGAMVAQNANALYAANVNPTEDGTPAADFAIGAYNAASGLGSNPYEGDMDEIAFYSGVVLTTNQIWTHYTVGTNSSLGSSYAATVFASGSSVTNSDGVISERADLPTLYLRFNDAAYHPAANSGALGYWANGAVVSSDTVVAGPQGSNYPGFEAANPALSLDGSSQFVSLNNPAGLDITGQITLEAWIQPAATQGATARILSHGPETITSYLTSPTAPYVNAITNTSEVFLRIDGGTNYTVGSAHYDDGTGATTIYAASAPIPNGDLGGNAWVHLVGAYDGSKWNLYRNGALLASQAAPVGALQITGGDWAIGATGEGWGDNYAGGVDEVAIYDKALSASQVAAHYAGATVESIVLSISRTNGAVVVSWTGAGLLEQATTLTGSPNDWTYVTPAPAGNSYTVPAGAPAAFYRVVNFAAPTTAPSSFTMTVATGNGPFASQGKFQLVLSGSNYTLNPLTPNIAASHGSFNWSSSGVTGAASVVDASDGPGTAVFTFTSPSAGAFKLTFAAAPGASETGTFVLP